MPANALGSFQQVDLAQGPIRFRELSEGPPIVFVHGIVANGTSGAGLRLAWPTGFDASYRTGRSDPTRRASRPTRTSRFRSSPAWSRTFSLPGTSRT